MHLSLSRPFNWQPVFVDDDKVASRGSYLIPLLKRKYAARSPKPTPLEMYIDEG